MKQNMFVSTVVPENCFLKQNSGIIIYYYTSSKHLN